MITPAFSVSDAVAVINQTLDYAYPEMVVVGELSSLNTSKGKWLYADLKDDSSKLKLFGTVWQLPGPMEDGMIVEVLCQPKLHNLFGFSLQIKSIRPVGEGSIKRAGDLLKQKLEKEGLFSPERKRTIPYPPQKIGLIASVESAGYSDFIKIISERWPLLEIEVFNVAVQGVDAVGQIISAIEYFNSLSDLVDTVVITRGGGSIDDLSAFSDEKLVRAVASSRTPTLLAIGHERDESLAELVSDKRASTPSNAAELLVPDKKDEISGLEQLLERLGNDVNDFISNNESAISDYKLDLSDNLSRSLKMFEQRLKMKSDLLESAHPKNLMNRGFVFVQKDNKIVKFAKDLNQGDRLLLSFSDGNITTKVEGK